MKYSDLLVDWLAELGYTHCFFLAGGNIMHLLESCSRKFTCIPVVHEVAAGIAVITVCTREQKNVGEVTPQMMLRPLEQSLRTLCWAGALLALSLAYARLR